MDELQPKVQQIAPPKPQPPSIEVEPRLLEVLPARQSSLEAANVVKSAEAPPPHAQSAASVLRARSEFPFPRFPSSASGAPIVPQAPNSQPFYEKNDKSSRRPDSPPPSNDPELRKEKGKDRLDFIPPGDAFPARTRDATGWNQIPHVLRQNLEAAEIGDVDSMFTLGKAFAEGSGGFHVDIPWALIWLKAAAAGGSIDAMLMIGNLYKNGDVEHYEKRKGIKRVGESTDETKVYDYATALYWLELAAKNGNLEALVAIGECYEEGKGTARSYDKSFQYHMRAAERGHAKAANFIGTCYYNGMDGVVKMNMEKACYWFRKSAESGDDNGRCNLGMAYACGWCDDYRDYVEAAHWFWAAAVYGHHAKAAYELGKLIKLGLGVKKDIYLAMGWFLCAAEGGNKKAMYEAGIAYMDGSGCRMDLGLAITYLDGASSKGYIPAYVAMGNIFKTGGDGVPQNPEKAFEYYLRADQAGNPVGAFEVAACYERGFGTQRNIKTAVSLYLKLIATNSSRIPGECYYNLAQCYEYGKGVSQDTMQAYRYYEAGYSKEHIPCTIALARLLADGIGTYIPKNEERAFRLYEAAASKGNNPRAIYEVAMHYKSRYQQDKSNNANLDNCIKYLKVAKGFQFAPAMFELAALYMMLGNGEYIAEAVALVMDAARYGNVKAMELLVTMYEKGVEVDANGVLVKVTESPRQSFFGVAAGRISAGARNKTQSATAPSPPDSVNGAFVALKKDPVAANMWKQKISERKKERYQVEKEMEKIVKTKGIISEAVMDAFERLQIGN